MDSTSEENVTFRIKYRGKARQGLVSSFYGDIRKDWKHLAIQAFTKAINELERDLDEK
jgi:hypothetical protein